MSWAAGGRYWATRYWARRYWFKVGAPAVIGFPMSVTVTLRVTRSATYTLTMAQ